jgi:hypothetical protein
VKRIHVLGPIEAIEGGVRRNRAAYLGRQEDTRHDRHEFN